MTVLCLPSPPRFTLYRATEGLRGASCLITAVLLTLLGLLEALAAPAFEPDFPVVPPNSVARSFFGLPTRSST